MSANAPERVIETEWGQPFGALDARYLVDAVLIARPRQDLIRDIAEVLARERIPLAKIDSFPKSDQITMVLSLQVMDGEQLKRALAMLRDVAGVISAARG
jgi:GTP pyrophosphokinase